MNTKTLCTKPGLLAPVAREAAPDINDGTFTLLRRIVAITGNGERQCSYTDKQALGELAIKPHNTVVYLRALKACGYISLTRGHVTGFTAGRIVRIITLLRPMKLNGGCYD